jgi:hypothetical protein
MGVLRVTKRYAALGGVARGYEDHEQVIEEFGDLGTGVTLGVYNQRGRPAGSSGFVALRYAMVGVWKDGRVDEPRSTPTSPRPAQPPNGSRRNAGRQVAVRTSSGTSPTSEAFPRRALLLASAERDSPGPQSDGSWWVPLGDRAAIFDYALGSTAITYVAWITREDEYATNPTHGSGSGSRSVRSRPTNGGRCRALGRIQTATGLHGRLEHGPGSRTQPRTRHV